MTTSDEGPELKRRLAGRLLTDVITSRGFVLLPRRWFVTGGSLTRYHPLLE